MFIVNFSQAALVVLDTGAEAFSVVVVIGPLTEDVQECILLAGLWLFSLLVGGVANLRSVEMYMVLLLHWFGLG